MSPLTAVAPPAADDRDRLRAVLWALLLIRVRRAMDWQFPEYVKRSTGDERFRYQGPHVYNKRGDCEAHPR